MTLGIELPMPVHFDRTRVGQVWRVPYQERAAAAEAWAKQYGLQPSAADHLRIGLLLVDVQNTFCIPGFELFVGGQSGLGAVQDNCRLCEFIYRNLGLITEIIPTLDTHTAIQIFHPIFWVNAAGEHPSPMTLIAAQDVQQGVWRINPRIMASLPEPDQVSLEAYTLHYVQSLSQSGQYPLMIWPYHSMLGGIGHALVSAVEEACFFHAIARQQQTRFEIKGNHPLTEHYSVLRPEVMHHPSGRAIAQKNVGLIQHLLAFDALYVAGQAKSHCVAWSVADLLAEIQAVDPGLASRVHLLEDCSSPVVIPGLVDFTDQANAAFQRFAAAGMQIVQSTDPLMRHSR
jgi:nicotinamidase-related amidase